MEYLAGIAGLCGIDPEVRSAKALMRLSFAAFLCAIVVYLVSGVIVDVRGPYLLIEPGQSDWEVQLLKVAGVAQRVALAAFGTYVVMALEMRSRPSPPDP